MVGSQCEIADGLVSARRSIEHVTPNDTYVAFTSTSSYTLITIRAASIKPYAAIDREYAPSEIIHQKQLHGRVRRS